MYGNADMQMAELFPFPSPPSLPACPSAASHLFKEQCDGLVWLSGEAPGGAGWRSLAADQGAAGWKPWLDHEGAGAQDLVSAGENHVQGEAETSGAS